MVAERIPVQPTRWQMLTAQDLKEWREKEDLARRVVAYWLGVHESTVEEWEAGTHIPTLDLQERLVELIAGKDLPAYPGSRRDGRRRHRWRHVKPVELLEWREAVGMARDQVASLLGVHEATVGGWERDAWAPPPAMQRRIRLLIASVRDSRGPGYENGRDNNRAPAQAGKDEGSVDVQTESSALQRVVAAIEKQKSERIKLDNNYGECRWGTVDDVVILQSKVTDMIYAIDNVSSTFFRSTAPGSSRITADSPRGVIHQDRNWLYPALTDKVPSGRAVIARYHRGEVPAQAAAPAPTTSRSGTGRVAAPAAAPAPAKKEDQPVTTATTAQPASVASKADDTTISAITARDISRMIITSTTKAIELGPHQVCALLRKAGKQVSDNASVVANQDGSVTVRVSTPTTPGASGHFFDEATESVLQLRITSEQLGRLLSHVGKTVGSKPKASVTANGYLKIEWIEESERSETL